MAKGGSYSHRNQSVDPSHFAMVPRNDVPRSVFKVQHSLKTTIGAMKLIPFYCNEILPGDSFSVRATIFSRMSTLLFPLMDNLELCSFFFFVPNRLVWTNWQRFMGEQDNPSDSISYTVPQINFLATPVVGSLFDFFGLPVARLSTSVGPYSVNALPFRAYNLIYNQWFRDENLNTSQVVQTDNGPDPSSNYGIVSRCKRHDYFTSCLPWTQKGGFVVSALNGLAPIQGLGLSGLNTSGSVGTVYETDNAIATSYPNATEPNVTNTLWIQQSGSTGLPLVYANLARATAMTVNTLRQSFQIQKLLEKDARGGTRYTEILKSHFGVMSPDARLQRPEYLGGGCTPININPIAQTSVTGATPQGNLAGVGHTVAQHGFSKSFVEHGYVIGLISVRADITYQQGLHKMWTRQTRYDFYWPSFAHLGEQAVLNQEIFCVGSAVPGQDQNVFGYQERYAEYRYKPSQVTSLFRSDVTGTFDPWHLSEYFTSLPALGATFIVGIPPVTRVIAAGSSGAATEFLIDALFDVKMARPMPTYSVPGFIDRF